MENKTDVNIENIRRMHEIARIYEATGQMEKSEMYHRAILNLCDETPKSETTLQYKIHSLNCLNKPYKSLETTGELLTLNPNNLMALINIANFLKGKSDV